MPGEPFELLPPMVARDVDLRAFEFMPVHITRLLRSTAWSLCRDKPELTFYMLNLWLAAWHEVPAASLPDDDRTLMALAQCPPRRWKFVRGLVLRGWVKCSDARRYHRVIAELAVEAWEKRSAHQSRTQAARNAKLLKHQAANASVTEDSNRPSTDSATGPVTGSKGQGQGQGEIRPSPPSTADAVEGADFQAGDSEARPRRANGTNPRATGTNPRALGTNPRAIENRSLEAWRAALGPIAYVAATAGRPGTERLTWAHVATSLGADAATIASIKACGSGEFGIGCRNIADRDRFNSAQLEEKFRRAYEVAALKPAVTT
jgi:uncharacterized protein YdaU (DUF1376 family)